MLGAIIAAKDDAQALARTLAALVPAVAEGVLRSAMVLDQAKSPEIVRIVEAAGAGHLVGDAIASLGRAAKMIRTPWALLLIAGYVPEPGWFIEAAEFMANAGTLPGERKSHAIFADERTGIWRGLWLARKFRGPAPGLIMETAELRKIAASAKLFPPSPPRGGRKIILRSKLY